MTRPTITCACCGTTGIRGSYGWRNSCYKRWLNARRPADGPPPPKRPNAETARRALAALQQKAADRIEDYQWLCDEQNLTRQQAAWRLSVSVRQTYRWDTTTREGAAA
jgi:uncharacterized damage-inducible protein DinB